MKKIISLIIAVVLCFVFAVPSFAISEDDEMIVALDSLMPSANKVENIYDFGDILMDSAETELKTKSADAEDKYGFQFIFLTLKDSYGVDTTTFVTDFYDYYILKNGETPNAIIFTVDYANDVINGRAVGNVEQYITNEEVGVILDRAKDDSATFDAYEFFNGCIRESITAYNGNLSDNSDVYTAQNGYSYSYMVPFLDLQLPVASKYEYVYDFANILSDSEEQKLSNLAKEKIKESGLWIGYITYSDAYGRDTQTFTDDFYDYYVSHIVEKGTENQTSGILFAVDMDNREVYINTGGDASSLISSDKAYSLLDKTYQYASDGAYFKCLEKTTDVTFKYLYPNPWIPTKTSLIAAAIVAVVLPLILLAIHNKSNKMPRASEYLSTFKILSKHDTFLGHREEVLHDFYKQESSGGGGGGGHISGGGGSHGGGGHGF